jgi:transcriptional regulator with XRE-family HTH domain
MAAISYRPRLQEILDRIGKTQAELSRGVKIPKATISSYATNSRKSMPLYSAILITDWLNANGAEITERDLYDFIPA